MPIYEYQCEACDERFERLQRLDDPPVETCDECGGGPVRKLISAPAFQFKGSGWYVTDYARKDGSKDAKSGDSAKTSGGASETKTQKDTSTTKKAAAAKAT